MSIIIQLRPKVPQYLKRSYFISLHPCACQKDTSVSSFIADCVQLWCVFVPFCINRTCLDHLVVFFIFFYLHWNKSILGYKKVWMITCFSCYLNSCGKYFYFLIIYLFNYWNCSFTLIIICAFIFF